MKMKLNMKDFDFKQFFLQKGEKVGLWVCVGLMVLLVVFMIKDVAAGPSASGNAEELKDLSDKGKKTIVNSQPTAEIKLVPKAIQEATSPPPVPDSLFVLDRSFFDGGATEDRKWRSPAVLTLDDWRVHYQLINVPSLIITRVNGETMVYEVVPKGNEKIKDSIRTEADKKRRDRLEKKLKQMGLNAQQIQQILQRAGGAGGAGGPGMVGGPPGGMGGMRPGGMGGGPPGMPGMGGPPGMPGMGGAGQGVNPMQNFMSRMGGASNRMQMFGQGGADFGGAGTEYQLVPVPEDKVGGNELAQEIQPYRMVLISAAFPYKKQLEQFKLALRFTDIERMLADDKIHGGLEFAGIYVQRRQARPGQALEDKPWVDLPIETAMKHVMILAADPDKSEQDEKLEHFGIIATPNRLVMPRPKLDDRLHKEKYPEELPPSVEASLEAMEQATKGQGPATQKKKSKFDLESFDLFGDQDRSTDPNQQATGTKPQGSQTIQNTTEETPRPEKILVRFYDTTVEPGYTYQYRVQVRMANPNYKNESRAVSKNITLEKEIRGPWEVMPQLVRVPDEFLFYAADEKRSEGHVYTTAAPMQVQRWLEKIQTDPNNRRSELLVGDWSVLERDMVRRGEYIGGVKETDVPVWWPTLKKYQFALHPDEAKKKRPSGASRFSRQQGVPVDFNTQALLVDFEGGRRTYQVGPNKIPDESPIEVLVLTKDGKLVVHDGKTDTENEERAKRVEEWKTTLRNVKEDTDNKSPSGKPGSLENLLGPGKPGKGGM